MNGSSNNSCRSLPPCPACGNPARVLLSLAALSLCPSCSRDAGVELKTGRDLSAALARRLASAPTREIRRSRRPELSEEQKAAMVAKLNRILAEVSHA
jgi:hypothetical protein